MKVPPMVLIGTSPGRTENLSRPPFSRLLKGKGGSRSGGISTHHSSPLFTMNGEGMQEKEPGSPKVTCIGQVRIVKKHTKKKKKKKKKKKLRCYLLCNTVSNGKSICEWRKWKKWLTQCYPKKEEVEHPKVGGLEAEVKGPKREEVEFEETAPPKNALLLMRCRSAPQRDARSAREIMRGGKVEREGEREREEEIAGSGRSPSFLLPSRALTLTRCKSEPARRWGGAKQSWFFRYHSPRKSRRLLGLVVEAFPWPLPHV